MPRTEAHKQQLQAASANASKPQETPNNLDHQYNQTSTDHHNHHNSSLGDPEAVNDNQIRGAADDNNNSPAAVVVESRGKNGAAAAAASVGHQPHQQHQQLPSGSKFRCYLCETPKHEYSLIRSFSEIVCRSCLNYEGPERVEQLILDARRDKGGSSNSSGSYHHNSVAASIVGPQPPLPSQRLPYTRQPRQLAGGGGRRPLPPQQPPPPSNAAAGGRTLGTEQNVVPQPFAHNPANNSSSSSLPAQASPANRQQWPLSSYSSVSAPPLPVAGACDPTTPPEPAAKRRRGEPAPGATSLLPVESSLPELEAAGGKCQQRRGSTTTLSPTPKLAWRSNDSAEHNSNNKPTQLNQNHQTRQQQHQLQHQPSCRSASTSLGSYSYYHHQPSQQATYSHPHYHTVGSPILAASAGSQQHQASLLQETIGARNTAGSLSPISLSASPSGAGCASGSVKQKRPPSAALATPVVGFAHQTARQQHMQTAAPLPPLPPPPPLPPSHLPYLLNFPPMVRNLGPSPCDQYAREHHQAAYEFYMGQQRSHLAQEAVSHHQLYPSSQHQQFGAGGAGATTKGSQHQTSRSRPALASLRCPGGPLPVPPSAAVAASSHLAMLAHSDKSQQALNPIGLYPQQPPPGSPYGPHHISPYVSQLADMHYGCPIPIPYSQHHHHNASAMGSMLAAAAAAANRLPGYGGGGPINSTSMMMSEPRLKGSSSSSTACGDEPVPAGNPGHDYYLQHQHQIDSNLLARHLMQQNESFHHQMQQIARKQFSSPITSTRNHHRPQPAPAPPTTIASGESGPSMAADPHHHHQHLQPIDCGNSISPQLSSSPPPPPRPAGQDSIPNTETTLRILLNQDKLVCDGSAANGSRQLTAAGRPAKEPEVGENIKDKSPGSSSNLGQASKYAPSSGGGGSTILSHNHNPSKAFQLEPIVPAAINAKRRYNLEEISPPPKTYKPSAQKQEQMITSKRNQSLQAKQQQEQQPILINEDELEMGQLEVNLTTTTGKPRTYSNAPNSGLSYQPSRAKNFRLSSGGGDNNNNKNSKSLLTTLVDPTVGAPAAAPTTAPEVAPNAPNESPQATNGNYSLRSQSTDQQSATLLAPAATGANLSGKINGFGGDAYQNAEQQNGIRSSSLSKNRNTNSISGQPTSGGAANTTTASNHTAQGGPSFDQLKCLLCQERLEDRHFVQCPTVQLHKFCFACSKSSIKRQKKVNQELKSNEDKIFCPSGKKCLLASEHSPWTFMNNEIETIFREKPLQPIAAAPEATEAATVSIAPQPPPTDLITNHLRPTDRQHSKGLNGVGHGLAKPKGSGMKNGGSNLSLDTTLCNNIATMKENSTSNKNNCDNARHPTKQQQ